MGDKPVYEYRVWPSDIAAATRLGYPDIFQDLSAALVTAGHWKMAGNTPVLQRRVVGSWETFGKGGADE